MLACEYVLIRLAPDPLRQEAVNIGVALYQPGQLGGFAGVRLASDLRRARQLSPLFQADDLAGLEADLLARLRTASPAWLSREYFLQFAQESFSHCLQLSPPTAVLTLDPAAELERLYQQFAAPHAPVRAEAEAGPRHQILRHLHRVFSEERLLARLQRNLRVGEWLGEADSFRFDFHYQPPAGLRHVLQAMPLGDDGPVRELCYTVGRARRRLGGLEAAAFVDMAPSDFQSEMFQEAAVRVLGLDQAVAEAARIRAALL